jgi:filamentous hemagglutinin
VSFGGTQTFTAGTGGVTTINSTTSGASVSVTGTVATDNGGDLTINTPSLNNIGTIQAADALTIQNTAGNLSITQTGGNGTLTSGAPVTINAGVSAGTPGSVTATQTNLSPKLIGTAWTNYSLSLTGSAGLLLGNIAAKNGHAQIVVAGGNLTVADGSTLSATEGNLTLQNTDSAAGTITIGSAASSGITLTGFSAVNDQLGEVFILLGPAPNPPTNHTAPSGISVSTSNFGDAYFGNDSISAAGSNQVNVNGALVVFNNAGAARTGAISLSGGVLINSTAPPPQFTTIDLTQSVVTNRIISLQSLGRLGGALLTSGGVATGGNVTFGFGNFQNTLTAINIPASVTVGILDANGTLPLSLTASSTTKQLLINGTFEFTSSTAPLNPSSPTISVTSTAGVTPFVSIGSNGQLTSSGSLMLNTTSLTNNGLIRGTATTVGITGSTGLTLGGSGTITSGTTTTLTATAGTLAFAGSTQTVNGNLVMNGNGASGAITIDAASAVKATGNLAFNTTSLTDSGVITSTNGGSISFASTGALTIPDWFQSRTAAAQFPCWQREERCLRSTPLIHLIRAQPVPPHLRPKAPVSALPSTLPLERLWASAMADWL